ncbi:hypothetical protein T492DRAFT_1047044 [Pavlovales sp. CCMP2436]|nr:hypothetical protein T492DRAFT_1047044 [Pavlovales sp. CCMP2436]
MMNAVARKKAIMPPCHVISVKLLLHCPRPSFRSFAGLAVARSQPARSLVFVNHRRHPAIMPNNITYRTSERLCRAPRYSFSPSGLVGQQRLRRVAAKPKPKSNSPKNTKNTTPEGGRSPKPKRNRGPTFEVMIEEEPEEIDEEEQPIPREDAAALAELRGARRKRSTADNEVQQKSQN